MRIVMIASLYRPYVRGGAEVVFQMLVDELKKNHDVIVVSICPWRGFRSLIPQMSQEEGVRVYRFFPLNFSFLTILKRPFILRLFWHILDAFNIHAYYVVRSILKKECPDLVMTHNLKGIGLMIPRAIGSCRIPHIHTVHDIGLIYPSGILLYGEESLPVNRCMAIVSDAITRRCFGSPTLVVFASRFLADFYARHSFFSRSKKAVIQNPIHHEAEQEYTHSSKHDGRPVVFTFVGQLEPHKGIEFLLLAWKRWERADVRLHIVGRGSVEAAARQVAKSDSRITVFGYQDDGASFLVDASFMIVPSLCYENAPMIIRESHALGIPVLASRIGGVTEYIEEGVNGFLFQPGNEQSLLATLERAVSSIDHYSTLSDKARESVKGYSVRRYCEELLRAIR